MARKKQVPVRREESSEFFNKETATWEDTNGKIKQESQSSDAGVLQLVISVVGIYASL